MKKEQSYRVFFQDAWGHALRAIPTILGVSAVICLAFPTNSFAAQSNVQATQTVQQQQRIVKGSVIDEKGEPLIGVSVLIKGTTTGTITDFDGKFSLDVPAGHNTLEVSYIGYRTQDVTIGNAPLVIKMQPDNKLLDEVVVIGYGTVKRRDLTGAIASVKGDDITLNPGSRPMDALQGKIAGLDITKSSGQAGANSTIQLRGTRSLQMDDDGKATGGGPTYIIDGMPGDINTLNPNDIESIEILKDASSTAVYGSSGANGVIIVTTKGAKVGKATINFNAYAGFTGWETLPKMRSRESFIQVRRDAARAIGASTELGDLFNNASELAAVQNNQWIDWADAVLSKGFEQNYSLSVSGGTEKTKAYFSLNFSDERSMYKNDNYKVYSSRLRIDQNINQWIDTGINIQASYTHRNARSGVLEDALRAIPLGQLYDENGKINLYPVAGNTDTNPSILADEQPGVYKNQSNVGRIYIDAYIDYKPIKGLSIRSMLGGSYSSTRTGKFSGIDSYNYLKNGKGTDQVNATVSTPNSYNYKWENIVTYHTVIDNDHDITLTGVSTYNHNQSEDYSMYGTNISDNKLLWYGLNGDNINNKSLTSKYSMSKGMGFVARVNYSYKGKYLFSASCRWDGSSRLAKGNQWDSFPAVSAGWRISDESFMEPTQSWLDNLKVRIGWGISGTTAGINPYSAVSGIEQSATNISGQKVPTTLFSKNIANPKLTWERSYNTNIGLDASFLSNRIDLTVDYYNTITKDVIMSVNMPNTMGGYNASTPYVMNANLGKTQNRGIEVALTTHNITNRDFTWTSTLTFAKNKEKITALTEGQDMMINAKNSDLVWKLGSPIYSYYGYLFKGIWQYSEAETAALFGCKPGDVKVEYASVKHDANGYYYEEEATDGDGKVTTKRVDITAENPYTQRDGSDRQVLGHKNPDWSGGFKNTFTYKNFDLSVFLYARWGQMMKYDKVIGLYDPAGTTYNFPTYFTYYDTTIEADQHVLFPAARANTKFQDYNNYTSTYYVNGSFWKIKNVTLGYTLPRKYCNKVGISNLRVYGTITNLFVFSPSKYVKDYDPEMDGSVNFPLSKELVFGVNLTF